MFGINFDSAAMFKIVIVLVCFVVSPVYAMGQEHELIGLIAGQFVDQPGESVRVKTTTPIPMTMIDGEGDILCVCRASHASYQAVADVFATKVTCMADCIESASNVLFVGASTALVAEVLLSNSSCLHAIKHNPRLVEMWGISGAITLVTVLSSVLCPVRPLQEMCVESAINLQKQD